MYKNKRALKNTKVLNLLLIPAVRVQNTVNMQVTPDVHTEQYGYYWSRCRLFQI